MTIDGIAVGRIVQPQSVEELSELLSAEKSAVVPLGAGGQSSFGNPLRRADCVLDLRRLSRITEYVPADLTIHVEAGMTLAVLQQTLLDNNQFLPLDPWSGDASTIGGIAAVNAQGPFRAAGTLRDWIIGMKVVEVDGRISKAGGRVVKNVTGYDLQKLYAGSLGSLAVIAEISLKLRAKFGRTATAIARFEGAAPAAAALTEVRSNGLQPVSCEWIGPENEIWLRFGDAPAAVEWQLRHLPERATWKIVEGADEQAVWAQLRGIYNGLGPIVLRTIALPTAAAEIVTEYRPQAWIAHALNGIVLMQISSSDEIDAVRRKYRAVVEKAPVEMRRRIPAFSLTNAEYDWMKRMKDAFDPEGRLNPGRHVDGERPQN